MALILCFQSSDSYLPFSDWCVQFLLCIVTRASNSETFQRNLWPNVLQNSNLLHVLEEFPQHFHVRAIEMPRRPTGSHAAAEFRKFRGGSEGMADLGLRACVSTSQQNSNILYNKCNSVVWSRRGMRGKVYHPDVMSLSQRPRHHPEILDWYHAARPLRPSSYKLLAERWDLSNVLRTGQAKRNRLFWKI